MKQPGKLHHHSIEEIILQRCGAERNEVSTGAAFGVDVSVIDLPNGLAMAMTSDPLSLLPSLGLQENLKMAQILLTIPCSSIITHYLLIWFIYHFREEYQYIILGDVR